jgi:hypothetical protein
MTPLTKAMLVLGLAVAAWSAPLIAVRATEGARTTADEPQYLLTALSLGEDRSLDVRDERATQRHRPFHEAGLPLQENLQPDGSRVSPHDPLLPALLAVPMTLGGWIGAKVALAAMAGALAAAMLWVAVRRFDVPLWVAVLAVATYSLAAPLAVYGTQVYPELPAALAVTVAIGALTGPLDRRAVFLLGAAALALPWLAVKYLPVAAALVLVSAVRLCARDRRALAALTIGLGAGAVLYLAAHQAWYGGWTAYAAGDHFVAGEFGAIGFDPDYGGRAHRLTGLLVDRGFGLAAWQPAFLLAVPALAALLRRRPPGWSALMVPLVAGWLTATFVALSMHDWAWPGRQVVVVTPCLVLAVAWWAARVEAVRPWLAAGAALGALTFAWLTVDGLAGLRLVTEFETTTNPFYRLWRHALPDGLGLPAGTAALRALWYALLALLAVVGVRSVRAARSTERDPEPESPEPEPTEAPTCALVPS